MNRQQQFQTFILERVRQGYQEQLRSRVHLQRLQKY